MRDSSLDVANGEFDPGYHRAERLRQVDLLNIIGGFFNRYDGDVVVHGNRPGRASTIGSVFQEESTFAWRTAIENAMLPLEAIGVSKQERLQRARDTIALVGLEGFENHYPKRPCPAACASAGTIARTLVVRPQILLMDEPFAALDEQTRILLGDKVLQIQQQLKQTTVLITHNRRKPCS